MSIARVGRLFAGFLLAVLAISCAPAAFARAPIEAFIRDPVTRTPAISPSGRYLAVSKAPDHRGMATIEIYDLQAPTVALKGTKSPPGFRVDWVQ